MKKTIMAVTKLVISTIFLFSVLEPVKALAVEPEPANAILVLSISDFEAFEACGVVDRSLGRIEQIGIERLAIPESQADQKIAYYMTCPAVSEAYLEQRSFLDSTPIDPDYESKQYNLQQLGMEAVWEITTGSSDVIVAVIDSGVDVDWGLGNFDPDHFVLGASFLTDFSNMSYIQEDQYLGQYSYDGGSHGTAVASVIGASMDDFAITGIAPGVKIMPIKVFTDEELGLESYANDTDIAAAIVWATDHGADIINMSFGGSNETSIERACEYAYAHGVILVASTGNDSNHYGINGSVKHALQKSPASYPEVIGVGSIDSTNTLSNFSDIGTGDRLEVVTYGESIYLPWNESGQYEYLDGTSFSAPTVSAVLALMLSVNPSLTPKEARSLLISTADDLKGTLLSTYYDVYTGYGKLDPMEAVLSARDFDRSTTDSNQDFDNAVRIVAGKPQTESLSFIDDVDYFTFTLYEPSIVTFTATPGGSEDLHIRMFNAGKTQFDYIDSYSNGVRELSTESMQPGVYYLSVSDNDSVQYSTQYTLSITVITAKSTIEVSTKEGIIKNHSTVYSDVNVNIKSVLDYTISITKDGELITITEPLVLSEPGAYIITVDDILNAPITFDFVIKNTLDFEGVGDGLLYNTPRTITFSSGSATLNGNPFESGNTVDVEGTHTLVITDGEYSETITFTLDLTAPVVNIANGDRFFDRVTVTYSDGKAFLDQKEISNNTSVTTTGFHDLVITDVAGNVTSVRFYIISSPNPVISSFIKTSRSFTITFNAPTLDVVFIYIAPSSSGPFELVEEVSPVGSYTITGLTPSTNYSIRLVASVTINGVTRTQTNDYTWGTLPEYQLTFPEGSVLNVTPYNNFTAKLEWPAVPGAEGYEVWDFDYWGDILLTSTTTATTYTATNMSPEWGYNNYDFAVRYYKTVNGVKVYSPFIIQRIVYKLTPPSNLVATSKSMTSIDVSWNAVPGAVNYTVRYTDRLTRLSKTLTVTSTKVTLTGLTSFVTYEIEVNVKLMNKTYTPYTSDYSDIVHAKPTFVGPLLKGTINGISSLTLSWPAMPDAIGYSLYYFDETTGQYEFGADTLLTSLTLTELTMGRTYSFKVKAFTIYAGVRYYGLESNFVSLTPAPVAITGLKALDVKIGSLKIGWSPMDGAEGYEVCQATTTTGACVSLGTTTDTSFEKQGLSFNTTYYYKVRAYLTYNGTRVYGAYSTAFALKTAVPVVTDPVASSSDYNAIRLNWTPILGASGYEVWRSTGTSTTYALVKTQTTVGFINTALVTNTTYNFKIRAYRLVGTTKIYGSFSTIVSAKPIPSVPTITVVSGGTNALNVSWPAIAGASGYEVSFAASEDGTYTLLPLQTATTATINGLIVDTPYFVKVRAYRLVGTLKVYSGFSSVVSAKPLPLTPTLTGTSGGFDRVNLSWSAIAGASGYELYRLDGDTYTLISDQTGLTYIDDELVTGTTHSYKVVAYAILSDVKIRSLDSTVLNVTPIPALATNLNVSFIDYNLLSLDWADVSGASGYEVSFATTATGAASVIADVSVSDYTRTGLTFNTTGYYRVRAYTTVNDVKVYGNWTTVLAVKTALNAVADPSAAYTSYNSIQINWSAVNGASGYEVWRSTGTSTTYALVKTQTTVGFLNTALLTNTKYNYKIRAYRLVGTTKVYGAYSGIVSSTPLPWAPNPTASSAAYNALKISWPAVAGANGYEVSYATSEAGPFTVLPTTTLTSATITNLLTNSTYTVRVRAYRIVSYKKVFGAYSSFITGTPIPSTPAPKVVSGGYDSLNLSWLAIPGATGYDVKWLNPATSTYETLIDTTGLSTVHSGLVSGVTQSYRVYAYRLVGETKVYSPASVVITGTPLPATVLGLKLSATNVSTLDFTWTPVLGASGYEVARSTTSTGVYTTLGSTETAAYQVTGLTFNTTSYVKVRAYTLVGDVKVYGDWTTVVLGKTLPGTPAITLSSPSYTSVQVDWAAVNGVTGYEIWRSTGTSTTYTLIKTQTTVGFLNTGLVFNTRYNYKIRAYKLVGTTKVYGSYSAITSQTPQVSAPSVLSESTYDSITLNWAAVSGANGYEVAIATSEVGPFTVSLQTTLTKTFSGLTTGSTYYVKVRSYRLISTTKIYGPYTSVIAVTPSLQVPTLQISGMTSTSITVSWDSVPGATDYEVRIRQNVSEAEWVIEEVSELTVTFNDLDPSAFYAIQIRSLTKDTAVPVYSVFSEELTFSYSETS